MEVIPLFAISFVLGMIGYHIQMIKEELEESNRLRRIELERKTT